MTDIEKNAGMNSAGNTLTNVPGASSGAANHGAQGQSSYPVGAEDGGGYPYTLGATRPQQQLFQGGLQLRKFANPAPLGLLSFASTTLILSLVNVQARGVTTPNVVVGMALFVGGLCQLLAGMWEFAAGNTLGATAFSSYGGFWLSFGTIYIPNSGIIAAYTSEAELDHAVGFYLAVWFIFTFIMLLAALRSNAGLITLFFFLTITFMFLMIGHYVTNTNLIKAGGGFGIITAFIAYYCGAANMLSRESSFFTLPLAPIPAAKRQA